MSATGVSLRKAAVLVASLDQPVAQKLLERIEAGQAGRVRTAMAELGEVPPKERRRVIKEFLRIGPLIPPRDTAGIELNDRLAEKLAARDAPQNLDHVAVKPPDAPPFRFLHEAATDTLTEFLVHERPQAIAVVLSHLPSQRSAAIVARLPATMQAEVLRQLVEMDATDPEIIRRVECELESVLRDQFHKPNHRPPGLSVACEILGAVAPEDRQQIITNLSGCDAELAGKLRLLATSLSPGPKVNGSDGLRATMSGALKAPAAVTTHPVGPKSDSPSASSADQWEHDPPVELGFTDFADFDNRSLAAILHAADPQVALLALTGAPAPLVDRILQQVPPQEAKTLRRKMGQIGPLRLTDVEQAQQHLADLAAELVNAGTIRLPNSRRFTAAA